MNHQFSSYTQSSAFRLDLTMTAAQELANMYVWEKGLVKRGRRPQEHGHYIGYKSQENYLLRRGLVQRTGNDDRRVFCLTRAGIFTCQLLREAGIEPRAGWGPNEASMDAMFPPIDGAPLSAGAIRCIARGWGHTDTVLEAAIDNTMSVSLDAIMFEEPATRPVST